MWHVLALALGGRTVAEWRATMTLPEFNAWAEFYRQQPFDDRHRYHRPAAMIACSMNSAMSFEDRVEFLEPEPIPEGMTRADVAALKVFGIKPNFGEE